MALNTEAQNIYIDNYFIKNVYRSATTFDLTYPKLI